MPLPARNFGLFLSLILATLTAPFLGCHRNGGAPADHPQIAAGVMMRDVVFFSASLQRTMPYRVFLPAKVDDGRKLPVVYLLHGNGGGFREWSNDSDVSKYAAQGLILVMPEGESSYYLNAVENARDRYEDYLTKDLIADVEGRFAAKTGRESRAIVGVSMGGFAAVKLALSRPELYSFAGGISPAIDVAERRFSLRRWDQWWRFRALFGSMGSAERKARNPFDLVKVADPRATPYLYLGAGDKEALLEPNQRFTARLKVQGFAFEFHERSGGHDWWQWDTQIPGCFASLLARMKPLTFAG